MKPPRPVRVGFALGLTLVMAIAMLGVGIGTVVVITTAASVFAVYISFEATFFNKSTENNMNLIDAADNLAYQVSGELEDMAVTREVNERPMSASWSAASPDLVQEWRDITATASGWPDTDPSRWASMPSDLNGSGANLMATLDRVPTGRLLVLGESGSGKTMQLIFLMQQLLLRRKQRRREDREPDPVPLLVPLASWDPDKKNLYDWLLARLAVDYPVLKKPAPANLADQTLGQALIARRWLLPILDGFDEIPVNRRFRALERINDALWGGGRLVMSSRTSEYRETVHAAQRKLYGAAGIELDTLDVAEVKDYIRREAEDSADWARRWGPVLAALDDNGHPISQAFRTPLMVTLACDIYNPRSDRQGPLPIPAELCRYHDRAEVENHLLEALIPAAYRPGSKHPSPWEAKAEGYLIFLAYHLEHDLNGAKDLAWWQLARKGPEPARRLHWSPKTFRARMRFVLSFALAASAVFSLLFGLLFNAQFGLVFGPIVGLTCGLGTSLAVAREAVPTDLTSAVSPDKVLVEDRRTFIWWIVVGPLIGLSLGLVVRLLVKPDVNMVRAPELGWLFPAPVIGLFIMLMLRSGTKVLRRILIGLAATITVWLIGWLLNAPMSTLIGALLQELTGRRMPGLVAGMLVGLIAGITAGIFLGYSHSAWGAYSVARCRIVFQSRRRLPWRLMKFLADAHQPREVLRQAGAYYQFRHRKLQKHLAERYI